MTTAQKIETAFSLIAEPLTARQVQQATGLHPAVIRRHVREPQYSRIYCEWATRQWQYSWKLNRVEEKS